MPPSGLTGDRGPLIKYRISKNEFRMMKFKTFHLAFDIRHSLFDILRFAFELLCSLRRSLSLRV